MAFVVRKMRDKGSLLRRHVAAHLATPSTPNLSRA